jgi:predicted glycosyltransferase
MTRALRVLLVANDGLSAGHVVRAIAVARGLARRSKARRVDVQLLLATTSQAHGLLARGDEPFAVIQLPAPANARRAGLSDADRRQLVRGTLGAAVDAFAPDVVVCDTFPSGPHGELGSEVGRARRVLLRRAVPEPANDPILTNGLDGYHLAIVADDPGPTAARLPVPIARVPAITLGEAIDARPRDEARRALGIAADARAILVAAGGGGDAEAARHALAIAKAIRQVSPTAHVSLARGPLGHEERLAPLQPWLAAFDGAFSSAGYNTAHELAKARVPAALFAQARPFDDQKARVQRFEQASLARAQASFEVDAVAAALGWMQHANIGKIAPGGADRAADAILDLVGA